MTHVQHNPNPWPVDLPEYRDETGRVWPTTHVEAHADVTWPIRIAGFEGFPEPEPPAEAAPGPEPAEQATDAQGPDTPGDTPTATAAVPSRKSKSAAAPADGGKEA
jgi:hypothetical protein